MFRHRGRHADKLPDPAPGRSPADLGRALAAARRDLRDTRKVLAVLLARSGGEVTITLAEMASPAATAEVRIVQETHGVRAWITTTPGRSPR